MSTLIFIGSGLILFGLFCYGVYLKSKSDKNIFLYATPTPPNTNHSIPFGEDNVRNNISEPVLSFVKTIKDNPSRFKFKIKNYCGYFGRYQVSLLDLKLGTEYEVYGSLTIDNLSVKSISWLTDQEKSYLKEEITELLNLRITRWENMQAIRKYGFCDKGREQFKELYCKGDE